MTLCNITCYSEYGDFHLKRKFIENKFFFKILITYCVIIITGLSLMSYYIISNMMNKLIESESKYANELLEKTKFYNENMFQDINGVFYHFYTDNYYSSSIVDILSNQSPIPKSEERKIIDSLQTIGRAHSFIADILILDYQHQKVFFYSNESIVCLYV